MTGNTRYNVFEDMTFYKSEVLKLGYHIAEWTFKTNPVFYAKNGEAGTGLKVNYESLTSLKAAVIGFIIFNLPNEDDYRTYFEKRMSNM